MIKENIKMQKLLSELSELTIDSSIKAIESSNFYIDIHRMKILLTSIGIFVKIRRKQIKCFFRLIDSLMPKISQYFKKEEMMTLFKRKEIHLKLLKDGYLTIQDIISYYGLKNRKLAFFYPELHILQIEYPTIIQDSKQSQKYRDVIEYFTKNKEQKEDPRLNEGNFDTLSSIIQKDDIEKFQIFTSHNDIKIQSHQIEISSFESNKCFNQSHIYLIEYSAFHCSLKIFKFLMMNNVTFSSQMLLRCAVCGGNNEIIHMAENAINKESLHKSKNEILSMSIVFHRYDITEYLVDSCGVSIEYDNWLNSILAGNYCFFLNHIIECCNEYDRLLELQKSGRLDDVDDFKLNEFKEKVNELALIAAQNVDVFFLKVIACFNNINLNLTGSYGLNQKKITCPLVLAIQSRNLDNVKFLISLESVDPDWVVVNDTTPFLWACYIGDLEIVKLLVENFYLNKNSIKNDDDLDDVNDSNQNEQSEVNTNSNLNQHSIKNEQSEVTIDSNLNQHSNENDQSEVTIDSNLNQNEQHESCNAKSESDIHSNLNLNEFSRNEKNVDLTQSKNFDNPEASSLDLNITESSSKESFQFPIEGSCSNFDLTEFLNSSQQNFKSPNRRINVLQLVEQTGENALHLATRECHLDVVKYLISLDVFDLSKPNLQGETCIEVAARLGYKDVFEFLKKISIENGLKIDEDLKVSDQKFLPQLHIKPLAMGLNMFDNLKEPISICLLI